MRNPNTLLSALSWYPHLLPYQNERLLHRVDAWRHVADSDLDWGQEGLARDRWLLQHPGGLVDPDVPAPGPMLVSANHLTGVLGDVARMACLRQYLPPHKHLAFAWYPYDLRPEQLEACFPRVDWDDTAGPLILGVDGRPTVLVARVRGEASIQVGSAAPITCPRSGGGEALVGAVVYAPAGDIQFSLSGRIESLYANGVPLPKTLLQGP